MITAIVIPADLAEPIRPEQLDELHPGGLNQLVGGYLEIVTLQHPTADLYLNEEGKLLGLPLNPRATALLWAHNHAYIGNDWIAGPAVIVGPPDRDGNDQSAPRELIDLLLHTTRYQVQIHSGTARRQAVPQTFGTWYAAYTAAIAVIRRSPAGTEVHVAAAGADETPQ